MPYIIFDIVILAVLAVFVARGIKKGFVLSLCGLLAVVVAFTGSVILANTLSPKVGELLEPKFAEFINTQAEEFLQNAGITLPSGVSTPAEELPFSDLLAALQENENFHILADVLEDFVGSGTTTAPTEALASITASLAQSVAYAVVFIVSFLLLSLAWTVLSHVLDLVSKLPVLNSLNKLGGAAAGLLKGCILLFVAAWLARFTENLIPTEAIEQTYLLKFFMTTNPVTLITGV